MPYQKDSLIVSTTFEFSLKIIKYCEALKKQRKFILSDQLFRSGTSIGANVREAQNAESRADFIHKLKIAAKEAAETSYWLELCEVSENYPPSNHLISDIQKIGRILSKIITTSKKRS